MKNIALQSFLETTTSEHEMARFNPLTTAKKIFEIIVIVNKSYEQICLGNLKKNFFFTPPIYVFAPGSPVTQSLLKVTFDIKFTEC